MQWGFLRVSHAMWQWLSIFKVISACLGTQLTFTPITEHFTEAFHLLWLGFVIIIWCLYHTKESVTSYVVCCWISSSSLHQPIVFKFIKWLKTTLLIMWYQNFNQSSLVCPYLKVEFQSIHTIFCQSISYCPHDMIFKKNWLHMELNMYLS